MQRSGHGVPHLPRRDLAPVQVGGEAGAAVQVGPVAVGRVVRQRAGEELLEPLVRAALARAPELAEAGRPGLHGLRAEVVERDAWRRPGGRRQGGGRRLRLVRRAGRQASAPERREHGVRPAVALAHRERIGQEVRLAGDDGVDAGRAQRGLERAVVGQLVRLQALGPDDRGRSRGPRQRGDDLHGVAALDQQPGTEITQPGVEAAQRVPEPPARRAAGRPGAALPRLPDEDGEERASLPAGAPGRLEQRRVVAEPEVAAQPEQRHGAVAGCSSPRCWAGRRC